MRKRRKRARARARVRVREWEGGGSHRSRKGSRGAGRGSGRAPGCARVQGPLSDMADIAQKLEQLEMAMVSSTTQDDAFHSHLASDTVHYNASDLFNWLVSMLSELNAPPPPLPSYTLIPNHQSNQFELPPVPAASASILDPTDCSTMTTADFPTPRHQAEYDLKPTSSAITTAPGHVVHGS